MPVISAVWSGYTYLNIWDLRYRDYVLLRAQAEQWSAAKKQQGRR